MTDPSTQRQPKKPVVIGLYGVPGSGKTYQLRELCQKLNTDTFAFYEGCEVIGAVTPGGLDAFKLMLEDEKARWRGEAITKIQRVCSKTGRVGVVTGHYMFWEQEDESGTSVITPSDLAVYTHIVYLEVPATLVLRRRQQDRTRERPVLSASHISRWRDTEEGQLRKHCLQNGILFTLWRGSCNLAELICHLSSHDEEHNRLVAEKCLDKAIEDVTDSGHLEKVLVLDADRTLTADDTGVIWWRELSQGKVVDPLRGVFGSNLGYSYTAFRQATLMYEEAASYKDFEAVCQSTAEAVRMYPQLLALLHLVSTHKHIHAIVLTSGLRLVWDKIIAREGLSNSVTVIGGERIADGLVVAPETKADLVKRLQVTHKLEVWAFGDSPLDIPMLKRANRAFVVVGEETTRSHSMDDELEKAIRLDNLLAEQVLLPSSVTPRLDTTILPTLDLMEPQFLNSLLRYRYDLTVIHATEKTTAKLLQTPMRDASNTGPSLRKAHKHTGRYLAVEYLSDLVGVEPYSIPHVQGHNTSGFRLAKEKDTLIVAMMRGGEPMALGVNDVFPTAEFLHAYKAEDVTLNRLQGRSTVLLVDSVINSGKSIIEFVHRIRSLVPGIRIIVVAGVVQAQAVAGNSPIAALSMGGKLTVVALRISENRFTGSKGTDTGNRLFNTVSLD